MAGTNFGAAVPRRHAAQLRKVRACLYFRAGCPELRLSNRPTPTGDQRSPWRRGRRPPAETDASIVGTNSN